MNIPGNWWTASGLHAATADNAANATNATSATNSDTVDSKHAADFVQMTGAQGPITGTKTFNDVKVVVELNIPQSAPSSPEDGDLWME